MTTTLTNRLITGFTAKYLWNGDSVKIIIDCNSPHNIVGLVEGSLSGCDAIQIEDLNKNLIPDFFNSVKKFIAKSSTRLESVDYSCKHGLSKFNIETNILGNSISFQINNQFYNLTAGVYTFKLTSDIACVFDGAIINLQEKSIYSINNKNYDSKIDTYGEIDNGHDSIDNQLLTFQSNAIVSVANIGSNTNIQLITIKHS
jgi:hypothetical protein